MTRLVKDIENWERIGLGKISSDSINDNPTRFKLVVDKIAERNPKFRCEIYTHKDKFGENYIINEYTSPEQVLEIVSNLIVLARKE